MIKFYCDYGQKIGVPREWAGRRVKCPHCRDVITVPPGESGRSDTALGMAMPAEQDAPADNEKSRRNWS